MFEIYESNGETFEVSLDQLNAFMEKYPDAAKVEQSNEVELYQNDDGEEFEVSLDKLDAFKEQHPNATKVGEPGKTIDSSTEPQATESNVTGSESVDGSLVLPEDKGFVEDMVQVFRQSRAVGGTVDEAFDIYKLGKDISDEQLQAVLDAKAEMDKYGPTNEQASFAKDQKANGGGIVGTLLALKDNIGFLPQLLVGSATTMLTSLQSDEVAGTTAVAAGVGAAGGAAAGASGFALGPLGVATTAAGAKLGAGAGAIGGLVGAMETGLTLMDLIQEEVGEGVKLTKENIRAVIDDTETFEKIKQRSAARGRNIGAIEAMTFGISRGVGSQLGKAGKFRRSLAAETSIETTGGFTGEIAGQIGAEQDIDLGEATLEGIGEVAGPGQIINLGEIVKATIQKSEYNINGEKRSKQEILDLIDSDKLTNEEKTKIKFNVKNDEKFAQFIGEKLNDISLETQIDAKVEDPGDRTKLVDLEKQRTKAKADTKKTGIFKVINADKKLEGVEMQINEIVGKYTAIDGRTADVRARSKIAKNVRETRKKILVEKIKSGVESSKLYKEMDISTEQVADPEKAYSMFLENEENNALFDIGLLQEELANVKTESEKKLIQAEIEAIEDGVGDIRQGKSEVMKTHGFLLEDSATGKMKIVINEKMAIADGGGNINVAAHEFLHAVLNKTFNTKENTFAVKTPRGLGASVGGSLFQYLKGLDPNIATNSFMGRLLSYAKQGEETMGQEVLNLMSDALVDGSFKPNETVLNTIGDYFTSVFEGLGTGKLKWKNPKDIARFIKNFNKSIKGDKLAARIVKKAEKGIDIVTQPTKQTDVKKAETPMSKEASNKVQDIYEKRGVGGAFDIIEQFKPIVGKIVQKRSEAPNFDRQLLTDEIETGKRGIFDLVKEYKPESGVPLAAYINKFLPSRAIEASRRVLGEEFTEDVSERVDIAAEEVEVEVKAKPKKKKIVLADRLGVTDKVSKAIKKIVPSLELDKLNFKTLKNKVPEITGELFGISPKKLISGANITKSELQSAQMFINKNADVLIAMLPEGATASGTATGVPNTLLKPFYTKTGRAKMAKTGTKAGLAVQVKNDNISKNDFLEVFGIVDGVPNRTDRNTSARVLALANQTGKMITNQSVRQEVGEATAQAKETINKLKDGKSKIMFSNDSQSFKNIYENKVGALSEALGYKLSPKKTAYRINSKGKRVPYQTRDLDAKFNKKETYRDAGVRVINTFLESYPQFRELIKITMTGGEQAGFFQTVPNFNNLINKTDVEQSYIGRTKYGGKGGVYDINHYNKLKKGELNEDNNKRLPLLLEFYEAIGAHLQNFPDDIVIFEEMVLDTGKQQNVFTRILAPFAFYPINPKTGKPIFNQKIAEEHTDPQNLIGKAMLSGALFGNLDQVWKVVGKSYMQGAILNSTQNPHDKTINSAGYQSSMPDVYYEKIVPRLISGELNLPNGYSSIVRLAAAGIDLNMYYLSEADMSIAKFFKVDKIKDTKKQNELIIQQLSGEITADYAENISKITFSKDIDNNKILNKAITFSRSTNNETKGITVLDFDDTLATTKSLVKFTRPDGTTGTLNAEEYASTYEDLLDQGFTFDFSDFNKVVKGKIAPLFQKAIKLQGKFGPENMFVLTARPPQAAKAIFDFLKANGLNIPIKNITGLGNSTAEAKALWVADKVGEGFNDFYFADDALQNVQAVDNMLEQFDVKRKVQQAKIKFSKDMNTDFNNILEEVTGIESEKRFSAIKGRKRGESKGKFRFFIPPSHEDFVGLLYNFLGKGKKGNAHRDFFEQSLVRPLNRANREYDTARQSVANDYKALNKQFEDVRKKLTKKTPDGDFTFQDAIRVYLWNKHNHNIPGLSPTDQTSLSELVMSDPQLQAYAETLNVISKQDTYVTPTEGWNSGDIRIDLDDATGRIGRQQFFGEFIENAEVIFSEENLNKIEASYGKGVRESLEDMLYRIKTGRNRPTGQNEQVNKLMNYLNGSVGTVMFFNMRSALLQQMSIVNYINFADNNIFAAAKAFANQKQYWADWSFIFNSDMLKQRRGGIQTDVNGAELAASLRNSKDITRKLISKLLELGFLPTQIGDNIAIATGGATYYRNRINKYIKQGLSQKEAEAKAFTDFQGITQSTQQSARPDMVSKQQASVIGKVILNFQNVTSQFNRLGKKAFQDIYNRRITGPNTTQMQSDISNAARITYYFAIQNAIFYTLQTALFAMMFDDDEEDDNKLFLKKKERLINGSIDSVLRGSGLVGGVVATLKNVAIAFARQRDVKYNPDESAVALEALNLSPVLGIKIRKIVNAEKTLNYNKKVIDEMSNLDIDNPQWSAVTNYTEAITNVPLNRLYNKTQNVRQALNNEHAAWERTLMFLGWSQYNLNLENKKMENIKESLKSKKKKKKKKEKVYSRGKVRGRVR